VKYGPITSKSDDRSRHKNCNTYCAASGTVELSLFENMSFNCGKSSAVIAVPTKDSDLEFHIILSITFTSSNIRTPSPRGSLSPASFFFFLNSVYLDNNNNKNSV
jgi:hypothetical protein